LLLPKTRRSGRTTTRSAKGRAGYARESIRRTREGIVREGKSNRPCGPCGDGSSRRSIASSEKGRFFECSHFCNRSSRFSAARQLAAQSQQGKKNRRAALHKAAQDGGNTENEIHEDTAEFRCRGACRHERVWQHQWVRRYQYWRGGDFTISVVYAPVDTNC
jgi:hypothetical protein